MSEDQEYEEFFVPKDALDADSLIVVDVRTPEEYEYGCVDNTVNIPLQELPYNYEHLRQYENVIVICQSGVRSEYAREFLKRAGFPRVYNGGGWQYFGELLEQNKH